MKKGEQSHKLNQLYFHGKTPNKSGSTLESRQRQTKQPLLIRMNLTERQMDRITDAFTKNVGSSPSRARPSVRVTPKEEVVPQTQQRFSSTHGATYSLSCGDDEDGFLMAASSLSDLTCGRQRYHHSVANLAERRERQTPASIKVWKGPKSPTSDDLLSRPPVKPVPHAVSPLSFVREEDHSRSGRREMISPNSLNTPSQKAAFQGTDSNFSMGVGSGSGVQDMHEEAWKQVDSAAKDTELRPHLKCLTQCSQRSDCTPDRQSCPERSAVPARPPSKPIRTPARGCTEQDFKSPLFSPLALYFRGQGFPTTKRGEKTLIGQNGWLERTSIASDEKQRKKAPPKKGGILGSIKKIARDMTAEFQNSNRRLQPSTKEIHTGHVRISLDAREQSLLYCELEYHLTTALNDYIAAELDKGHLVPDNLKQVSDSWASRGRPKVVAFRYDLETQLQLVSLHVRDFDFYGRRQSSPAEVGDLLSAMETHARQMRVRTFCQPDSVIAKQLVDAQSLLNLINVSDVQQLALSEAAQFFEVIVERERDQRKHRLHLVRRTYTPESHQHGASDERTHLEECRRKEQLHEIAASGRAPTYICE
ncbi:hypothetical protein XA68_18117 [Ophiocordyceps unilateralis]|uniref:Uncharacterized protein n=1 Tax=Ophiocordyceps unilateralis TaxID=268505 RepID=A0A2A9P2X6_OPHUN|nr:hypothetical protein XA68_18117 [Ophiocordyceps unilateralis]